MQNEILGTSSVQMNYPYWQESRTLQDNRAPLADLLYQEAQTPWSNVVNCISGSSCCTPDNIATDAKRKQIWRRDKENHKFSAALNMKVIYSKQSKVSSTNISKLPLHLIPCVIGRRGTASKTRRPSEIGITIIPALNMSSVIHASTSKSMIRSAKLYLQKVKNY